MKLESQIQARQYSIHLGLPACEDEDKPTFFFGALARAQLVDSASGDGYFDDLTWSTEELPAEYGESPNMMLKPADVPIQSEDRIYSSKTATFHIEQQQQEEGRHLGGFERIKIVTQGDSASGMQTMAEPAGSNFR